MTDFLSAFQRRDSDSEGSDIDDDQPEFAHEEIHHHSDDEPEEKPQTQQTQKPTTASKESESHKQHHTQHHGSHGNRHKNGRYLYQGEEAYYQSDEGEDEKGKGGKYHHPTQKKDPTYVPKGNFYQHDTRGNEGESSGKDGNKQANRKWKHDKYEKTYETKKDNKNYGNKYEGKKYEKYEKTYEPKQDKQEKYEKTYEKKQDKNQDKHYDKPQENKYEKGKRYDNVDVIYVPKNKPQDTSAQNQTKTKSGTGHHPHKQLNANSAQYQFQEKSEGTQFGQFKAERKEFFKKPVDSYVEYIPKDFDKSHENDKEKKK